MKKQEVNVCGETVVSLFRKAAKLYSKNNAVIYADKILTYAEFDELTDNIAAILVSLFDETAKQPVVGILTGRSENMPLSMMGAAKSGACYLPLDPSYPGERLAFMMKDSGAKYLIADSDLLPKVSDYAGENHIKIIYTDETLSLPKANSEILSHSPKPEDLITIIYTSGTTGQPKGTLIHHAGVLNFVNWYRKTTETAPGDNTVAYFSCGFIAHTMDIYSPLISGACMNVIPTQMRLNMPALKEFYETHNIEKAALTAQIARQFIMNYAPKTLKTLIIGSEAIIPFDVPKGLKLINMYGMTETSLCSTSYTFYDFSRNIPIGDPTPNMQVYILDEQGNLAPKGEIGELAVAGIQVAYGYINRDDLTAERFIKNPFSDDPNFARMYKTGDLVRLLPDGNIEYVGRSDFQVKISGFRVELPEIERRIREFPGVTGAAAIGADAPSGGKRILAYFTAETAVDVSVLNTFIAEKLPPYMVPFASLQIENIPLNQNGKLDRKALPKIEITEEAAVSPRNETEKFIAEVFVIIMGFTKIGVTSDLLKLGLSSLAGINAAALISDEFDVEISAPQIMRARTVEGIAKLITSEVTSETEEAETAAEEISYPLTKNQLGIYFACAADPDDLIYNDPCEIKFSANVDSERLCKSAAAVINAHAYFKTRIAEIGGETRQIKAFDKAANVSEKHCKEAEYTEIKKNFIRPFNLLGGDLYRIEIYKTEAAVYLLADFHHIIFDGSSMGIIIKDLAAAYSGKELQPESYTAFDVAESETDLENSAKYKKAKAYYKNLIGDMEGASKLPFQNNDSLSGVGTETAAIEISEIEGAIASFGVTPACMFLAATSVSVSRFAPDSIFDDNSLRIVSISSGREGSKIQNTVGMFVKTLPTVIDVTAEQSVSDFLLKVQDRMFGAIEHQAYQLMSASSEFDYDAALGFAYQGGLIDEYFFESEPCKLTQAPSKRAKFPIAVTVNKDGGRYTVLLEYDKSLFEPFFIKNLTDSIIYTAKILAANTNRRISEISVTTPEQRQKILASFAGEKTDEVRNETIVSLFRKAAKNYGENTAVVYTDKSLSYAKFDELTDNLAAKLVSLFGENNKQPIVAILVDRSELMPLSMMGVMKSGAAYLPLDPSYPADRLEYMLSDSGAMLLIADRDLAAKINIGDAVLIFTDEIYSLPGADSAVLNYAPKPEDLITLIYTSGTTGKPKGTKVHQAGVVNFVYYYRKICTMTSRDSVSAYIACGFDPHMQDLYPTLISGACLYVIPESMRLALGEMKDYFEENNITISAMPMQLGRQFMMNFLPKSLKVFTMGGEALTPFEPFDGLKVINLYGPTETSVAVTSFTVDKLYKKIPIGKAFDNTALYVLDNYGHLVPPGVAGELVISGVQVTNGYLGREDLTAEKFVKNPFSDDPDYARIYKTGDLARFLEDGNIDFLGRNDFQVKIRGFRVELPEIERRIREFEGISDVTVIAANVSENSGGKQILSYIVSDKTIDIAALNAFIEEKLPPYMVPAGTLQLSKLPLNQNGKIDRKALPEITVSEAEQTPPANDLEELISDVIAEITGNTIGVLTSLAGAGFDSLSAIRAAMLISEKTGANISAPRIMKAKTIRKLSEYLSTENKIEKETVETVKIAKIDNAVKPREYAPLTENQLGIYFACSKSPGSVTYNIPAEIKFSAKVNTDKLSESAKVVINAHPYIKTRLEEFEGEPRQFVLYDDPAEVHCRECSETELEKLKKNFVKPFELLGGRLYRIEIIKTEKSVYMLYDFHHIIFDGASVGIFIKDLAKAYSGETLEAEKHSAFELALFEKDLTTSQKYDEAKAFFDCLIGDGEGASQISDEKYADRSGAGTFTAKISRKTIDKALREYDVTPANFILSAAALTLSLYAPASLISGKSLRIATVSSGRDNLKYQNSFGMFVKTLPTAVDIKPEQSAARFISDVSDRVFDTIENQIYPYMQASSDFGYNAQVIFAYQGGLFSDITFEGEPFVQTGLELSDPKFPMTISADRDDTYYIISLEYDRSFFEDYYAANLAESIAFVAEELAVNSNRKISKISAASPKQKQQILEDFAGAKTDDVKDITIVDVFREIAEKLPFKTAVVYGETSLTYSELDKMTDCIAAFLYAQNSGKKPIAIMVGRSENIAIMALAALKSGAPYMPLDPGYPIERLRFMLSDSGAEILISDRGLDKYENGENDKNGASKFPEFRGKTLYTDDLRQEQAGRGLAMPAISESPKPDDDFILLYTSGTTGNPKGAVLLHKGVINYIDGYKKICNITEKDKITAYASFGFDANLMDLYSAMTSGACLYIIPEDIRLDLSAISDYLQKNEITVAFITTQIGRQLIESGNTGDLRVMGVGGEALVPIVPSSGLTLYNFYGPTETTVAVTYQKVDRLFKRVPIGRTVQNIANYILDKNDNLAPAGAIGELAVAGRQVSKGYHNREDLTAVKFVKNPFTNDPDYAVMYKTGDLARFLPDGSIDFFGRNDFQVKIRGFRVELTEIESRIREYPGITNAAVIAADAPSGGKRILAYIVSEKTVDISALNAFIEEKLPYYMVPAGTKQIPQIPINRNGKVNRNELPDIQASETAKTIVLPKTETERLVVGIAAQIMGERGISTDTNLMQSGLDSLSAIRLAAKISQNFGINISAPQIMKEKTIEHISAFLDSLKTEQNGKTPDDMGVISAPSAVSYPLTANQLGIYFACVKDPGGLSYNIPAQLKFPKGINSEKLKRSTEAVINAHSYIKTRLTLENTEPRQLRLDDNPAEVNLLKCTESEFAEIKSKFVKPFGLFDDNLYRITICETVKSVYLLADFHHIIFDGGSLEIFMSELSLAYDGTLPQKEEFTGFDNALYEEKEKSGAAYEKSKLFFDSLLKTLDNTSALPENKSGEIGKAATVSVKVNRSAVDSVIKNRGITAANHFLAATAFTISRFATSVHKLSGETEGLRVAIASINSGRDDVRLQRNFGMLVQTLPTIIDIAANETSEEFTAGVQDRMLETFENRFYPYMRVTSDYGYNPQIMYAFQGGVISKHTLSGEPFALAPLAGNAIKFPVNISISVIDKAYEVLIEYDTSKFSLSFINTFAESIAATAVKLAESTTLPICEIGVATENQLKTLNNFGRRFAKTELSNFAPFASLAEMFYAAVNKNAEKTALITCGESYTFAQLDEASDKIASALIKRGVNKGDRIAFKLHRNAAIPITMLGIIKSGACYIPIDPEYPEERILHILSDSGAKLLITAEVYDELSAYSEAEKANVSISPNDPCYIIYTSGSTGLPKGVVIPNGGIVNYCLDVPENRHVRALTETDAKMVSVTTVSFDMFLKEAFTTLMNGLTLVLADEKESKDLKKLARLFRTSGGNAFNATPSRMIGYLELDDFRNVIKDCKVVMAGGEKYPAALYRRLRSLTGAVLINTYGPTETTVSCNAKILDSEKITVGAPLYGATEMVADIYGNPLPVGVIGELYIGGAGLAREYYGNSELTKFAFVTKNSERFYKSGDLARFTESGEIEILGRNDGQIKLRGLRIELGEIENKLSVIDGISSCAVVVKKIRGNEHLAAYYTSAREISPEELRETLSRSLTKYMVPTAYLQMERFPTTPNGKTDLKALPEPKLLKSEDYEPPANQTEADFCAIFAALTGLERVGANDSFFDIGGTSLTVTQLTIEAMKKGFEIGYGDVFANPTPRQLAKLCGRTDGEIFGKDDDDFDYTAINNLLKENTIESFTLGKQREIGNICLTGATGFLGIHVLYEFLKNERGAAYCIVRGGKNDSVKRLKTLLVYYFSNSFDEVFGSRIVVIEGDVTSGETYEKLRSLPIDTLINCAANVKHFSAGTDIEDINVGGVKCAVDYCLKAGVRLIHISTASIAGMSVDGHPSPDTVLTEQMLWFGQDISNKYVRSKFAAERLVFEACVKKGLDAKIMRVGNLMARASDGEFQANFNTNSFLGMLKAYSVIGSVPYESMRRRAEFAPIDCTADAILRLSKTPNECRVFHPYNDHEVYIGDAINSLNSLGIKIKPCEMSEYNAAFAEAMANPSKAKNLNSLIAYNVRGKDVIGLDSQNEYTSDVLLRLGSMWPITGTDYLNNFFKGIIELGYFDRRKERRDNV